MYVLDKIRRSGVEGRRRWIESVVNFQRRKPEYHAASAIEVLYLRDLLENIDFAQDLDTPVYGDTTTCIKWGNHVIGGRERARHIDILKHFAHETIQNRQMWLIKGDPSNQLADVFTKALQHPQFLSGSCREGILLGRRALAVDLFFFFRQDLAAPGGGNKQQTKGSPPTHVRGWLLRISDSKILDSRD